MKTFTVEQFQEWGRAGGRKSRRKLTTEQARRTVAVRWAKRKAKK